MYAGCADVNAGQSGTRTYREAKRLPTTLLDLCTTHIEEGLYSQGFALLLNVLTSGTASSALALLPPAHHLSFAATLIVHPQLTTRTTSPDKHVAADDALRYLREVNSLVGPRNAHLDEAFEFLSNTPTSRHQRAKSRVHVLPDLYFVEDSISNGHINSLFASTSSLWTKASDFWSVLGWAFNCSIRHPDRWQRWKLLLNLLVDVVNDDLNLQLPAAEAARESGGRAGTQRLLSGCLITRYLSHIGAGRDNKRRLMRAIFADGSQRALAEFGEIWRNETKPPRTRADDPIRERQGLDIENGEFGDYLHNSEEESPVIQRYRSVIASSPSQLGAPFVGAEDKAVEKSRSMGTPKSSTFSPSVEGLGGPESIHLRQRILALLIRYCDLNPDDFLDTEELFDLYTEFLRPLPLHVFQQFCLPSKPYLPRQSQASLNQMLLRPLAASSALHDSEDFIAQTEFEEYYALQTANSSSAVDNAKVGLLVESLLRLLWAAGALRVTEALKAAVKRGKDARIAKMGWSGKKAAGMKAKDEEAACALRASGERMMMLLDMGT